MIKKLSLLFSSVVLLVGLNVMSVEKVSANQVIDEKWGTPTFVYGSALTPEQIKQTKELLGITDKETIDISITGKDMTRLLGSGNPNANMYSSALIQGNELNGGISVQIKTPENITKVTQNQYANALITAGAKDVVVTVASPVKVTGESALTGVYMAYEDKGVVLDQDAMNVAQEELEVISDISQELAENEEYDSELLNAALIQIKQELGKAVEDDKDLTEKEITEIVLSAIAENGLEEMVTDEQTQRLVNLSKAYLAIDNFWTPERKAQLEELSNKVAEHTKELLSEAGKILSDPGFWEKIWNGIKAVWNFFVEFGSYIFDFFSSEEAIIE